MTSDTSPNHKLANYLIAQRKNCLDDYVARLHAQDGNFSKEDALTTRIRGGGMLDALIQYLQTNQMDKLLEYFQVSCRQLLIANYNFEQIKLAYNLLEQTVLVIIPSSETSFEVPLHFLKSAMQIARMIAVNQYVAYISNRPTPSVSGSNGTGLNNISPTFNPGNSRPINQNQAPLPGYNFEPPSKPKLPAPEPITFETSRRPKNTRLSGATSAYLEWPLKALAGTRPPEYTAFFEDGSRLQVLLVDNTQAYAAQGLNSNGRVICQVRQIGPLALAYPI